MSGYKKKPPKKAIESSSLKEEDSATKSPSQTDEDSEITKTEKQSKSCRWIKGTLTRPKDKAFNGDTKERNEIIDILKCSSIAFSWCLLSFEDSNIDQEVSNKHYHFIVVYKSCVKDTTVACLRSYWDKDSKSNEIKLGTGRPNDWVGYIGKDDDYIVFGEPSVNIETAVMNYKKKLSLTSLASYEGVKITEAVQYEHQIGNWLKNYMVKNDVLVNYHTRQLRGTTKKLFFNGLEKAGFHALYGSKGVKLAKELIYDPCYYVLPMWNPDLNWVSFMDGWWNINEGKFVSLDNAPKDIVPVREYPFDFEDAEPVLFLGLIKRMGLDLESFKEAYGLQFLQKRRRDRVLLIYGKPFSGKSTLILPLLDIFRDVITQWTDDGSFAYSSIASSSKCYCEEIDIFDPEHSYNSMKKLLEGVAFNVKVKHGIPTECIPKTVTVVTNSVPPFLTTDVHQQALLGRMSIFDSGESIDKKTADQEMMQKIIDEAHRVLVWATKK